MDIRDIVLYLRAAGVVVAGTVPAEPVAVNQSQAA
jgi:hypothetical protein